MKLTDNILFRIEKLKHCMALSITDVESGRKPTLYYVHGYKSVTVPEKKGFFGHPAYEKLLKINLTFSDNVNSRFTSFIDSDFDRMLDIMEKDRERWLKLEKQLTEFGFTLKQPD